MNPKYYTTNKDEKRYEWSGRALIPPGGDEDDAIMWCGEPEDFSFYRDLNPILSELNKLVDKIEELKTVIEKQNAIIKSLNVIQARGLKDLETIKGQKQAIIWLEEQNEKMKKVLELIASEPCQAVGNDFNTFALRKCYEQNPGHPDMWCYPCRAKKALED